MRPGKVTLLVFGVIIGLLGLGLIAGGSFLGWAHATQRDGGGYYTSQLGTYTTQSYAITSGTVDLVDDVTEISWIPDDLFGDIRITVTGADNEPIFVGIGRESDVRALLRDVEVDEVQTVDFAPFEVTYQRSSGDSSPQPPGSQDFWVASANGTDRQTMTWDVTEGRYVLVIMNADASAGVNASVTAAARTDILLPLAGAMLTVGFVLGMGGAVMMVTALAGRRPTNGTPTGTTVAPYGSPMNASVESQDRPPASYPVRMSGHLEPQLSRWMWLVKWLLAFPHWVLLGLLWLAFGLLTFFTGFAVLLTGRYPRSIFDFNVGVLRWTWRVHFYASVLGTDRYPPFSLEADPTYPADLDVDYPERLSRGLVLVKWWLLALPHYLIVAIFGGGIFALTWSWGGDNPGQFLLGTGLIGIVVFIAAIILLASGAYPRAIFDPVMGMERWIYRVIGYAALMRDEYPPFRLDAGGADPGVASESVPIGPPPMRVGP